MSKRFECQVAVLKDENSVARCVLPDGHRFVMLMRGQKPIVAETVESGEYEIDATMLDDPCWPVGVCTIDLKHIPAWLSVTPDAVGRMIDRIERSAPPAEAKD